MKPVKITKAQALSRSASAFISSRDLGSFVQQKMEVQCFPKTPIQGLDLLPNCLVPGTVTVICSSPVIGKSAYLINLAIEAQDKKLNMAVFLTESSTQEFSFKAICARAKTNGFGLMRGRFTCEKWPDIKRSTKEFSAPGLYFADRSTLTVGEIADDVQLLTDILKRDGHKLDAILLDSVNYLSPQDCYPEAFQDLKRIATALGVAVICSFNLAPTPSMRGGHMKLGDTRLAGLDERCIDQIYYLHRPECFNRADPTIVGQAALFRLHPFIGDKAAIYLRFDINTLIFNIHG